MLTCSISKTSISKLQVLKLQFLWDFEQISVFLVSSILLRLEHWQVMKKKEVQEGPQESSALFTQLHSISSADLLLLVIVQPYLCSVSCTSGPA